MAVSEGRRITVLEDDVIISHHFQERMQQVLSFLPEDWGFIKWGSNFASPSYVWADFGISKATICQYGNRRYQGIEGNRQFQTEDHFSYPVRMLHSFGFQGYSITADAARAALDHCLPLRTE